jgi:hypothetical protein
VTVDDDCGYSAMFFEALAELAKSLADDELAIYEASFNYLAFGGWTLVTGTSHKRWRFDFDGKEGWLEVFASEYPNQGSPSQWKSIDRRQVGAHANCSQQFELVRNIAGDALKA